MDNKFCDNCKCLIHPGQVIDTDIWIERDIIVNGLFETCRDCGQIHLRPEYSNLAKTTKKMNVLINKLAGQLELN